MSGRGRARFRIPITSAELDGSDGVDGGFDWQHICHLGAALCFMIYIPTCCVRFGSICARQYRVSCLLSILTLPWLLFQGRLPGLMYTWDYINTSPRRYTEEIHVFRDCSGSSAAFSMPVSPRNPLRTRRSSISPSESMDPESCYQPGHNMSL